MAIIYIKQCVYRECRRSYYRPKKATGIFGFDVTLHTKMHIECTRLIVLAVSPSIQEVTSSLRNLVTYSNVAVLYYAIMLEKRAECDKQKGAKFFPF